MLRIVQKSLTLPFRKISTQVRDKATGNSKGFGFLTFKSIQSAVNALSVTSRSSVIDGRKIQWNLAIKGKRSMDLTPEPSMGAYDASYTMSSYPSTYQTHPPSSVSKHEKIDDDMDTADRKIFVRGLSWDTTTSTLLDIFGKYGPIEEGSVCRDRHSGRSKGFGFVTFVKAESAAEALKDEAKVIDGRTTHCNLAIKGKFRNRGGRSSHHRNQRNQNAHPHMVTPPQIHTHVMHYPGTTPAGFMQYIGAPSQYGRMGV